MAQASKVIWDLKSIIYPRRPQRRRVWGRGKSTGAGEHLVVLHLGWDWAFIVILWNSSVHLEIPVKREEGAEELKMGCLSRRVQDSSEL